MSRDKVPPKPNTSKYLHTFFPSSTSESRESEDLRRCDNKKSWFRGESTEKRIIPLAEGETWFTEKVESVDPSVHPVDPWYTDDIWGDDIDLPFLDDLLHKELSEHKSFMVPSTSTPSPKIQRTSSFPPEVEPRGSLKRQYSNSRRHIPSQELAGPSVPVTVSSQVHSMEWLRSQLEKVNKEFSSLKESILVKDGESSILRQKLNAALSTIEKQRLDKEKELGAVKFEFHAKIKELERSLESSKTQAMFKEKEAESNLERYRELKNCNVRNPDLGAFEVPASASFRKFSESSVRPGEIYMSETQHIEVPEKHDSIMLECQLTRKYFNFGDELETWVSSCIFAKAKPEFNFVIPPIVDYYPFNILYRDVCEIPLDNYKGEQKKLEDIWKVRRKNVGVDLKIDDSGDLCQDGRQDEDQPYQLFLGKSRYFTSLDKIHLSICKLIHQPNWFGSQCITEVLRHVTGMARELYVATCDPRLICAAHSSFHDRENEVLNYCFNSNELDREFNFFSNCAWNEKEIYIDLRRGVALIAVMCSADPDLANAILIGQSEVERSGNFQQVSLSDQSGVPLNQMKPMTSSQTASDVVVSRSSKSTDRSSLFQGTEDSDVLPTQCVNEELNKIEAAIAQSLDMDAVVPASSSFDKNVEKHVTSEVMNMIVGEKNENINLIETKIEVSWTKLMASLKNREGKKSEEGNANVEVSELCGSQSDKSEDSSLLERSICKESTNWEKILSRDLSPAESSRTLLTVRDKICVSDMEKDLLKLALENLEQIKGKLESKQRKKKKNTPSLESDTSPLNRVQNKKKEETFEIPETRKRKNENVNLNSSKKIALSCENQTSCRERYKTKDSSSGESSRKYHFSVKHDVAPFKKPLKEEMPCKSEDLDKEIVNEVEKLMSARLHQPIEIEIIPNEIKAVPLEFKVKPMEEKSESVSEFDVDEKISILEEMYNFKKKAFNASLLELLYELIKTIGKLRYTVNFNPLFASVIYLLQSFLKHGSSASALRLGRVVSIVREILYCRPSPLVILYINKLFVRSISVPGFFQRMCHNACPTTFVIQDEAYFKRGSCLLEVLCILVDFSLRNDNWEIPFLMSRWLSYVFLVEKTTVKLWYSQQKTSSRHCHCIRSLSNVLINIYYRAANHYSSTSLEDKFNSHTERQLNEILENGVQILDLMIKHDLYFFQNISTRYEKYYRCLETLEYLHSRKERFKSLNLSESNMRTVSLLLNDIQNMSKYRPPNMKQPNELEYVSNIFQSESQFENLTDMLKMDQLLLSTKLVYQATKPVQDSAVTENV